MNALASSASRRVGVFLQGFKPPPLRFARREKFGKGQNLCVYDTRTNGTQLAYMLWSLGSVRYGSQYPTVSCPHNSALTRIPSFTCLQSSKLIPIRWNIVGWTTENGKPANS
eukprot:5995371-Amphidinium_carterae.2